MTVIAMVGIGASVVAPGTGQAIAGKRTLAAVWAALALASTLLVCLSVWMIPTIVALRLLAVGDAFRCLRRHAPQPAWPVVATAALAGVLGLVHAQRTVRVFTIPSSSMEPTLRVGDEILVDTLAWHHRAPTRGEIVVFGSPCSEQTLVKRLIARGGDTVEVRCGRVYVNGAVADARASAGADVHDFPRLDIPVVPRCTGTDPQRPQPIGHVVEATPRAAARPCDPQLHLEIPRGALFFLGDNRANANDSRYLGLVDERSVIGVVVGTIGGSGWRDLR